MQVVITIPVNLILLAFPLNFALTFLNLINTSSNKNELLKDHNVSFKVKAIKIVLFLILLVLFLPALSSIYKSADASLDILGFLIETVLGYILVRILLIKKLSSTFSDAVFIVYLIEVIFSSILYVGLTHSEGWGAAVVMLGLVMIMSVTYLTSFVTLLMNYNNNKDIILGLKK